MAVTVEVCVDSVDGALAAREGGAGRVELCQGLAEGGTTASAGALTAACEHSGLDVVALIRPRGGDFLYDDVELDVMRRDVAFAGRAGAAGVALGVLERSGAIDFAATEELALLARPMTVTFHRAFDLVRDRDEALDALLAIGVDRVLTSGGAATAAEGADALRELHERADGRLVVLGAGGIRPHNARALIETTGLREIHAALRDAATVRAVVTAVIRNQVRPHRKSQSSE